MFLGGCPCCGKKDCWRCYGKQDFPPVDCNGLIFENDFTSWSVNADSLGENANGPGSNPPEEFINKDLLLSWLQSVTWKTKTYAVQDDPAVPPYFAQDWFSQTGGDPGSLDDLGCDWPSSVEDPSPYGISIWPLYTWSPCGYMQFAESVAFLGEKYTFGRIHSDIQEDQIMSISVGNQIYRWGPNCDNPNIFSPDSMVAQIWSCKGRNDGYANLWQYRINGGSVNFSNKCIEEPSDPSDINFTSYQCFDAPPDEDGWTPVGKCYPTEEECAKKCPPTPCDNPCDDPCNAPFQTAGYIARGKAIEWKESGGIVGDVFPGGPTLIGDIQSAEGVVTFENFGNGVVMDGQQSTNTTGRDVVVGLSASQNRFPEFSLECLPAETSTLIDYAPMQDPANRVLIETQSYSPAFNQPEGTSGIIEISTGMAKIIGVDSDKRVLLRSCSFGGVTYINNIDAALPSTFAPVIRFVHQPWCADEIPSGIGFGKTFYIPHTEWSGKVSVEFDVVKSNDIDDIILSYNFDWLWTDAFQQPNCGEECPTPGGRTMPTKTNGPGTELANLLKWFNIHAKEKGCGCKSMQRKMDKGGPQWCRDHQEEILAHLEKEAKKRKLPFVKQVAKQVVLLAIRRAEKKS